MGVASNAGSVDLVVDRCVLSTDVDIRGGQVDASLEILIEVGQSVASVPDVFYPSVVAALRTSMVSQVVPRRRASKRLPASIMCSLSIDAGLRCGDEAPVDQGLGVVWVGSYELGCA